MCDVLIVHTDETHDWATYLQVILEASDHFPQGSIKLYLADGEKSIQDYDCSVFSTSKCILLLLSLAFLDIQREPDVWDTYEQVLYPPCKVIAFLCGVSEDDDLVDCFEYWTSWRKLDSEDDPSVYVSTVLEVIAGENVTHPEDQWGTEEEMPPLNDLDLDALDPPEELVLPDQSHIPDEHPDVQDSTHETIGIVSQALSPEPSSADVLCLTVQPQRILCGTMVDIYVIMLNKLDSQASMEVEFHCEHSTKRVPGTLVNEYIVRAQSPDMPSGAVSLHVYSNGSNICSRTVIYYTEMEEINCYLKKVMDPLQFMCQAFNITSNTSEALDDLLTNSLKKHIPEHGLQVFGIDQLEQENTFTNRPNVELPTLLHFSAKFGLKKLTSTLLRCPGAMQAYSVMNKDGDYPNTLAEKSGFSDLRRFMDDYVETVDLEKSHIEESPATPEDEDIYEPMANPAQALEANFSLQEDIYESMMELNPDMQLYEDLNNSFSESEHPEEVILRKFFQEEKPQENSETMEEELANDDDYPFMKANETAEDNSEGYSEEEDPYKICSPDEIYDTVDEQDTCSASAILNRPPAPVPRPATLSEPEECKTYISTVFSSKRSLCSTGSSSSQRQNQTSEDSLWPERDTEVTTHDPYAGMKTPGQKQLISLQERVKVGALTVEEAVQEFKAWQFDQEKRSQSIRFQQENLQRLRDSITRRHKEKGRSGRGEELEITAPMQRNLRWGSHINIECSVYEPSPRATTQTPPVSQPPQRGTWQTGSTSSTSSSGSNRLSTLSTISYSSGADGELEEPQESVPPRPLRPAPPVLPPPRVPPRTSEWFPESLLHERYVPSPSRALPQLPPQRAIPSIPAPPIPPRPVQPRPW
ncbi:phosphoinositide 3-kinase adapter protein 1 isoform X3 [Brachyhypopomus gauderio]|uniref:phosphoinositide 3-kinase adapter protein 1 isoform X3 n=1 Tax=Brachyhypopomus gauderio TaxID=698409 RepID=UPI00404392C5